MHIPDEGPLYSEKADRIRKAVGALNESDEALQLLSRRIARALTSFDAGFIQKDRPLTSFLMVGRPASPLGQIVETVADMWIGKPWGNARSFTYVDCSAYHTPFPNSLARLIGPLPTDASGRTQSPILSQLQSPHFSARHKDELRKLWGWHRHFISIHEKQIDNLGAELEMKVRMQLGQLVQKRQYQLFEKEEKREPFRSVIFFDMVDRGNAELMELIRSILLGGRIVVFPNTLVNFSRTLVFIGMYDEDRILSKSSMGLKETESQSPYHAARRNLFRQPLIAGLAKDMGENILVLSDRTEESQAAQASSSLELVATTLKSLGVELAFTERFRKEFLKDTHDPFLKTYTEARLRHALEKHVLYHLGRLKIADKLNRASRIEFDAREEKNFTPKVHIAKEGIDPVDNEAMRRAFEGEVEADVPKEELLKQPDIKALNDEAIQALTEARKIATRQ